MPSYHILANSLLFVEVAEEGLTWKMMVHAENEIRLGRAEHLGRRDGQFKVQILALPLSWVNASEGLNFSLPQFAQLSAG